MTSWITLTQTCNLLLPQSASSDLSLQSFLPSHLCFTGIHTPFPHVNCPSLQAGPKAESKRECERECET